MQKSPAPWRCLIRPKTGCTDGRRTVLEVGTFVGLSTTLSLAGGGRTRVVSIDPDLPIDDVVVEDGMIAIAEGASSARLRGRAVPGDPHLASSSIRGSTRSTAPAVTASG
jgi:hypothetical protein